MRIATPSILLFALGSLMAIVFAPHAASAADLVTLSRENYSQFAPQGKEARAFIGDYVLRNDKITLAVADPRLLSGRSASRWSIPNVSGAIIDLARLDAPQKAGGDFLRAYYPAPFRFKPDAPNFANEFVSEFDAAGLPERKPVHDKRVTLTLPAYEVASGKMLEELAKLPANVRGSTKPYVEVSYTLEDGWDHVLVESLYTNPTDKPFTLEPATLATTLRADDARDAGTDFDNKLFYIHDTSWRFAYGVLADGHTLAPQKTTTVGTRINHLHSDKSELTLAPGKSLKIARRIIPAENMFQLRLMAAKILHRTQRPVTIEVVAPDGPVAGALVTATSEGKPLGAARTNDQGTLTLDAGAGAISLTITAIGRATQSALLEGKDLRVTLSKPSLVSAVITNDQGEPLACKVKFDALTGEPVNFFPDTGEHAVRNLRYTEDGRFTQPIPPGKYRVTISAGPELDAVIRELDVAPEATTPLEASLKRVVNTPGWISADTHTHSAASGPQDIFYVYPYTPCATTDGASIASPLGRVLNLLCENIEFAPTSEHNFITTFEPHLKQLRAEGKMATVPGVGMTAGRRHTVAHQNTFPVQFVPGAQDGGAIQRPEHVAQITWLSQWYNSAERLMALSQPCDSPLAITPEVDVLDLQNLTPIIDGKPIPGTDDRVLDWVAALSRGFRLPALVSSNAYHNFHGSGGVRTYIASSTDDPAKIDAMELVRNLKRGKSVMTTGPFMQVTIVGNDKKESDPPAIKDSLRSENGKLSLHVRVQSSNWAQIDRVQILVGGERLPALNFTRAANADLFTQSAVQFDQVIPIELKNDAHLIVVASGTGPALRAGDARVTHVAVTNPIFVDTGKKGYEPASPLEDKIRSDLEFSRPLLARADAPTGHVRLTMRNTSDMPSEDSVTLKTMPENAVTIVGDATKKYSIAANGETFVEWELLFTPEFLKQSFPVRSTYNNAGTFGLRIDRSEKPPGRKGAGRWMEVDNPIRLLPPIASLDAVPAAVKNETPYLIRTRNDDTLAQIRMGISGDRLALHAAVTDAKPTRKDVIFEGSCIEVFGAMGIRDYSDANVYGGYRAINQLFLLPRAGQAPDQVMKQATGKIVPAPEVEMTTRATATGYELFALIPLSQLGLDVDFISRNIFFGGQNVPAAVLGLEPGVGRYRMEVRITAGANKAGDMQKGQLFRAGAPHVDHHDYGQFRLEAPVRAKVECITPLSFAAGSVGKFRMTLTNTSAAPAEGQATLRLTPEPAAKVVGEATRAFKLAAGQSSTFDFDVTPNDTFFSAVDLIVSRSPDGNVMTTPALTVPILDRAISQVGPIAAIESVPAALEKSREYTMNSIVPAGSTGVPIVKMKLAMAGDDLAILADVVDLKVTQNATPWKGSCFEVFAEGAGKKITQLFLQPGAEDAPARALLAGVDPPAPAPGVRVRTVPTATGYQMQALIPIKTLGTDATRPALEFQITATDDKGKPRRGVLFGSPRAYQDTQRYGRFKVTE